MATENSGNVVLLIDRQIRTAIAHRHLIRFKYGSSVRIAEPHDYGNVDTRLEPCRRPAPNIAGQWESITALPGVERVPKHNGRVSLRVRGIEFAELAEGQLYFGLNERTIFAVRTMAPSGTARTSRATGLGTSALAIS